MPTKHVIKTYGAPAFYHVYNRGSGDRYLFRDQADRGYFLTLLQKYLAENEQTNILNKTYEVEVVAYCLMSTHFHLLLFQQDDPQAISGYMRSVGTAYSMYYNKKYRSKGHVFQSSFRASLIGNESYLAHITRYIHLNPRRYATWKWSSYRLYVGQQEVDWVHPDRVLDNADKTKYATFVSDYANTDRRTQHSSLSGWLAV